MSDQKHILVVEDEKPLAEALSQQLGRRGYAVTVAEDGEDAIEKTKVQEFDLILLDIIMPKMDGFTVLELLKKAAESAEGTGTIIVVLSNLGQEEDIKRAKDLGADDYMVKANAPIAEIMKKVDAIL